MTMISRRFLVELKLHPEPAYRIAQQAGVNPSTLSKLIHGLAWWFASGGLAPSRWPLGKFKFTFPVLVWVSVI